jgi:hypothetical protein
MPNPKRVRLQITRKRKTKEKRRRTLRLRSDEIHEMQKRKRQMKSMIWGHFGQNDRSIRGVEEAHGLKTATVKFKPYPMWNEQEVTYKGPGFVSVIEALRKRFPHQTIQILDEGAGNSTFGAELLHESESKFGKNAVSVRTTDIRDTDYWFEGAPKTEATPEQLVQKFGREQFHLIVSTYGGLTYTTINPIRGLSNVITALKTGGQARLRIRTDIYTGQEKAFLHAISKLKKRYPLIKFSVKELRYRVGGRVEHIETGLYIIIDKNI